MSLTIMRKPYHESALHIDTAGADENSEESLRGVPTQGGRDRDSTQSASCRYTGRASILAVLQAHPAL
jgi:hypothetical protein